jgi:mannose-6-phosphate isomerase-like protein (cupin superfamily)
VEVPGLGPRDVGPGDVVFFPAGQPQTITNVGTVDLVLYAICTPPFEAENYVELSEPGS